MYTGIAALGLCAASVAAVATSAKEAIKIPLIRSAHYQPRADGEVDGPLFLHLLNNTLKKYGVSNTLPPIDAFGVLKRSTAKEPLFDQNSAGEDVLYYGNAVVGATNPQTFTVDFDTGSADFFVPGPRCTQSKAALGLRSTTRRAKTRPTPPA